MEPLVWSNVGGCIAVVYTPAFRDRVAEVEDAVDGWVGAPCGRTCFEPPEERGLPADGQPRIDTIHVVDVDAGGDQAAKVALAYQPGDGRILRAKIEIDPSLEATRLHRSLLRGFGRALGFDTPNADVSSVMHPRVDGLTEPTDADIQAYCARYGVCEP